MDKQLNKNMLRLMFILSVIAFIFLSFYSFSYGSTMFDNESTGALYNKYPLENYQLDFYFESSLLDLLPWNWGDSMISIVLVFFYFVANLIFMLSCFISYFTGYMVSQVYNFDLIDKTKDPIGNAISKIGGFSGGVPNQGGLMFTILVFAIFVTGLYILYLGVVKKQITSSFTSIISLTLVVILGGSFLAYSKEYINKVNDFSNEVSDLSLNIATNISDIDSNALGEEKIRDMLFNIQVKQPWLILNFGDTNKGNTKMLSLSPDDKMRNEIAKVEVLNKKNKMMSLSYAPMRLGMVLLFFLLNTVISIFVLIFAGLCILAQIMFLIFALLFPFTLILALFPNFSYMAQKGAIKLFNMFFVKTIMVFILSVVFALSSIVYSLSKDMNFIFIMFMQCVVFVGSYYKLPEILSMVELDGVHQKAKRFMGRYLPNKIANLGNKVKVKSDKKGSQGGFNGFGSYGGYTNKSSVPKFLPLGAFNTQKDKANSEYKYNDYQDNANKFNGDDNLDNENAKAKSRRNTNFIEYKGNINNSNDNISNDNLNKNVDNTDLDNRNVENNHTRNRNTSPTLNYSDVEKHKTENSFETDTKTNEVLENSLENNQNSRVNRSSNSSLENSLERNTTNTSSVDSKGETTTYTNTEPTYREYTNNKGATEPTNTVNKNVDSKVESKSEPTYKPYDNRENVTVDKRNTENHNVPKVSYDKNTDNLVNNKVNSTVETKTEPTYKPYDNRENVIVDKRTVENHNTPKTNYDKNVNTAVDSKPTYTPYENRTVEKPTTKVNTEVREVSKPIINNKQEVKTHTTYENKNVNEVVKDTKFKRNSFENKENVSNTNLNTNKKVNTERKTTRKSKRK